MPMFMTRVGPVGRGGRDARSRDFLACVASAAGDRSSHWRRDDLVPTRTALIKHTAAFTHAEPSKDVKPSARHRLQTVCGRHPHPNETMALYSWVKRRGRPVWAPKRARPTTSASAQPHETQFPPSAESVASIPFPAATSRGPSSHIPVDLDLVQ